MIIIIQKINFKEEAVMGHLSSILKLKNILKRHKSILFLDLLGVFFVAVIGIPIPYITGKIVDEIILSDKKWKMLIILSLILLVLYFIKYLLSIGTNYMTRKVNTVVGLDLKYDLIAKAIKLPMGYITKMGQGNLQGRLSESEMITNTLSATIISTLLSSVSAILSLTTMLAINIKLGIIVLCMVPIFFMITRASNTKLTEKTKEMMNANVVLNAEGFEILNGIEDIKILNGENACLFKFKEYLSNYMKQTLKQNKLILIIGQNTQLASDLGSLLILFLSCVFIIRGEFTIGLYTSFTLYSTKILVSASALSNIGPQLKQLCLSIDRVYELLNMTDDTEGRKNVIKNRIENVKFDAVSFRYNEKCKFVLDNINFKISRGEKILIKGENGSGKSTLIKLLLGLYHVEKGKIKYNGIDIDSIDLENLRNHIGIVSQKIFLFKGTVLDNIRVGQEEVTREDIEKCIDRLKLRTYINKLPNGLDTEVFQNSGISGGQTQVIAFIRAFVTKKDIIILDEPISNVDQETSELILQTLQNYNYDGIIIMVSHNTKKMEFITKTIQL